MDSLIKLRTYDSSDNDSEEESDELCHKRLPTPDFSFLESGSKQEVLLKQQNHDGRIRSFPHEPGNWATFVYIAVNPIFDFIDFIEHLEYYLKPLNFKMVDDFHISLSRTVILKYHWIQGFTDSIRNSLCNMSCFKIHLCGLETYLNEQNTRTFLSLKVNEGVENLKAIVNQLDNSFKDYNLQPFYENPSFHLSLFWSLGNKCSELNKLIDLLPSDLKTFGFSLEVSNCFCTSGLAPYCIGKDYEHTKRSKILVVYNLFLAIIALFNSLVDERFKKSIVYINKSFLISVSHNLIYVLKNIHPSLVSLKSMIFVNSSIKLWFKMKHINTKFKKLRAEFDQKQFKIYLYTKATAFLFSTFVFLGSDIILNDRLDIYRPANYWPFRGLISIYNSIIETAFGALVLLIYQRFWILNEFLNHTIEYKEKTEDILFKSSFVHGKPWECFASSFKSSKGNCTLGDKHLTRIRSNENSFTKNLPFFVMMKNYNECFGKNFADHKNISKTLQSLKKIHFELFEVTNHLNSVFGWNVVFLFATSFFESTINIFFIIVFHIKTFDTAAYVYCASWTATYLFKILYFVAYSNKVYKEVRRTVYLLHMLSAKIQFSDDRLRTNIKAFCLQLNQCEVQFTASKFFILDPAMLFQFVVGVLSSVAFMVQFDKINLYEK